MTRIVKSKTLPAEPYKVRRIADSRPGYYWEFKASPEIRAILIKRLRTGDGFTKEEARKFCRALKLVHNGKAVPWSRINAEPGL